MMQKNPTKDLRGVLHNLVFISQINEKDTMLKNMRKEAIRLIKEDGKRTFAFPYHCRKTKTTTQYIAQVEGDKLTIQEAS